MEAKGSAPSGYKGGRTFSNDGRNGGQVLPGTDSSGGVITYREWDINRFTPGVDRGPERLVAGSDGSAWYTFRSLRNVCEDKVIVGEDHLYRCEAPHLNVLARRGGERVGFDWPLQGGDGTVIRRLRGRKMRTVQCLYDEFAAALQFPDYFGENWAAFEECLSDLAWLPGSAYELIVTDADDLLSNEPMAEFAVFCRLIERVGAEWSKPVELGEAWDRPGRPFHLILLVDPNRPTALETRISSIGVPCARLELAADPIVFPPRT